jgi:ComEC/Rec2-related protein
MGGKAIWPAMLLIVVYCFAGGATPAAVRACAMAAMALLALQFGRTPHVWTSLALTAAAMLGCDPSLIWDVGFQLSFTGTVAIIVFGPVIERRLHWMPALLREPLAVTCAAQAGTLPLIASGFQLVSPVAPLANTLVLPLLPAIVACGFLLIPLGLVPVVGQWALVPLVASLEYIAQIAHWLARLPGAALTMPTAGQAWWIPYYLGLAAGVIAIRGAGKVRTWGLAATLSAMTVISGFELVNWTHPSPRAVVLDVGTGQAVLLQSPSGSILIDGGPDRARLAGAVGAYLPPWQRELPGVVMTGSSQAHVAGLADLRYKVGDLYQPEGEQTGSAWRTIAFSMLIRGAHLHLLHAGMWFRLAGFSIEALAPEPADPAPSQLALRVRGPSATFCDLADLDPDQQEEAVSYLNRGCEALLLPRGGSVRPGVLAAAHASRLLVSDGRGDRISPYLPPASLRRTSQEGDIEIPL